ncbi:hypothetical protein [Gordonia aichiensis]|uniref:Uncharacterized protein n=1 Tax=Gordonia aichiensis NBRC 108223 TaxID=1220583 RepID=L7KKM8_9ACTN|nr:hypothetical protein [Gordonia aichiensis]GAC49169.1 hypothetical protein GOACH_10_01370 [Gordonia aichiensis NBRC 108223]
MATAIPEVTTPDSEAPETTTSGGLELTDPTEETNSGTDAGEEPDEEGTTGAAAGPSSDAQDEQESEDGDGIDSERAQQVVGPGGTRRAALFAGGFLVAAGLAAGAVVTGVQHHDRTVAANRHAEVIAATKQAAKNLVTLRYGSADEDVKRIRENATGEFLNQMGDTTGSFSTVLQQGKVESTGEAREVAVLNADKTSATTIAAVTSTVKNAQAPEGQPRVYRMKVSLTNKDNRWLVSNVEFVS